MPSFMPAISYECISRALKILPNPVHPVVFCFLFVFTIPLAIIATITTTVAFSILLFRVALVYIELALAVIPYYTFGSQPIIAPVQIRESGMVQLAPTGRRRRRSSSLSSTMSASSPTITVGGDALLSQSVGPARDFEGVGGWRLGGPSDDEASWTKINSRLVLPADHDRRHRRSLTSGSVPLNSRNNRRSSPEAVMNSSRARTPPNIGFTTDGYFPQMALKKRTPSLVTVSSESSKGSTGLSMKQR